MVKSSIEEISYEGEALSEDAPNSFYSGSKIGKAISNASNYVVKNAWRLLPIGLERYYGRNFRN